MTATESESGGRPGYPAIGGRDRSSGRIHTYLVCELIAVIYSDSGDLPVIFNLTPGYGSACD